MYKKGACIDWWILIWNSGVVIIRDKTMNGKLMSIPFGEKQNYPFCILQLVVETFGHLIFGKSFQSY